MYISSLHRTISDKGKVQADQIVTGSNKDQYSKKLKQGTLNGGSLDLSFYDLQSEENIDEAIAVLSHLKERYQKRYVTIYRDNNSTIKLLKTSFQRLIFFDQDELLEIDIIDLEITDSPPVMGISNGAIINLQISERYYYVFLQQLENRLELMRLHMDNCQWELGLLGVRVYNIEHPHDMSAMSFWVELQVEKIIILSTKDKNESNQA